MSETIHVAGTALRLFRPTFLAVVACCAMAGSFETRADDTPLPARKTFVPIEDLDAVLTRDQEGVLLSRREFTELFDAAKANADNAPRLPASAVLSDATYDAKIDGDHLLITARIGFSQFSQGWTYLNFSIANLSVEKATLNGQPARLARTARTGKGQSGSNLVLFHNATGPATLELQLSTPLSPVGNDRAARFQLPLVPSATIHVDVPAGRHLQMGSRPLERPAAIDEVATYSVPVGGQRNILLLFSDHQDEQRTDTLTFATTAYGANVAPGEVTWQAKTSLQVFGTTLDGVVCTVPVRLEITDVDSTGLESWLLADNPDDPQSTLITLNYRQAFEGSREIVFRGVMATPAGEPWAVPELVIRNVTSHIGRVVVQHPPGVRVRLVEAVGSRASAGTAGSLVYDVWKEKFSLAFETRTKQRDVHSTVSTVLNLKPDGVTFNGRVQLTPYIAPLFEISFRLPADWIVDQVSVNGSDVAWQVGSREAGWNEYDVALAAPLPEGQDATFTFRSHRDVEDWPVEDTPAEFALPVVLLPGASVVEGTLVVTAGLDLDLVGTGLLGMDPTVVGETGERLGFAFQSAEYEGSLTVTRKPSRISAQTLSFTRLDREVLQSHLEATLDITGGGLRELEVGLSESAGEDLRFRLLNSAARIVEQIPGQPVDGVRLWKLKLDQRVIGTVTLTVAATTPRADGAEFAAHQLTVPDAERTNGFVAIEGAPDQQLNLAAVDAEGVDLGILDPIDVPTPQQYQPQERIVAAYRYTVPGHSVTLSETRFDRIAVPTAICYHSQIESVLGRTGQMQHRAEFQFVAVGAQSLRVRLPEGESTELWAALVDGQPIEVRSTSAGYLVPIPPGEQPDAQRQLALFYRTQIAPLSQTGTIEQQPPHVTVLHSAGAVQRLEILDQHWELTYPDGTILTSSSGDFSPVDELYSYSLLGMLRDSFTQIDQHQLVNNGLAALGILVIVGVIGFILRRQGVSVLGCLGASVASVVLLFMLLLPAVQQSREVASRSFNHSAARQVEPYFDSDSPPSVSVEEGGSVFGWHDQSDDCDGKALTRIDVGSPQDEMSTLQPDISSARMMGPSGGDEESTPESTDSPAVIRNIQAPKNTVVTTTEPANPFTVQPGSPPALPAAVDSVTRQPIGSAVLEENIFVTEARAGQQIAQVERQKHRDRVEIGEREFAEIRPSFWRRQARGLLSLSLELEHPGDSWSRAFRYSGNRNAANGTGLKVDWQERDAGDYARVFLMVTVALCLWVTLGAKAQTRAVLAILGLSLPVALISVAPLAIHPVLDGVFLGAVLSLALWLLRAVYQFLRQPSAVERIRRLATSAKTRTAASMILFLIVSGSSTEFVEADARGAERPAGRSQADCGKAMESSPEGTLANSPGFQPREKQHRSHKAPEGRRRIPQDRLPSPLQGFDESTARIPRAESPWLFAVAPAGFEGSAATKSNREHGGAGPTVPGFDFHEPTALAASPGSGGFCAPGPDASAFDSRRSGLNEVPLGVGLGGAFAPLRIATLLVSQFVTFAEPAEPQPAAEKSQKEAANAQPASSDELPQPERVLVPYDPNGDPLNAERVLLTRQQFLRLWNLAHPDQRVEPQAEREGVVSDAFYDCRIKAGNDQAIAVRATLVLHSMRDEQVVLPIPLGPVALKSATLDGKPAALSVESRKGQNRLLVVLDSPGLHTLDLKFDVPAQVNGSVGQFQLPVQGVPSGRAVFALPQPGLSVRVNGSTSAYRLVTADDSQSIHVPVDAGHALTIAWRPPEQLGMVASIVHVDSATTVSIDDAGVTEFANVSIRVPQGAIADLSFDIPAGLRVQRITGPHLAGWGFNEENDQRRLRVLFSPPITEATQLNLQLFLEQQIDDAAAINLPTIAPLEVTRETGLIGVVAPEGLTVRSGQVSGLIQVNVSDNLPLPAVTGEAGSGRNSKGGAAASASYTRRLAWRYTNRPFELNLNVVRQRPESTATVEHAATVGSRKIVVDSFVRASLKGSPRTALTFELAEDFLVLNVDATSLADWYVAESDGLNPRTLTVEFTQPLIGDVDVVLKGQTARNPDPFVLVEPPRPLELSGRTTWAGVWFDEAFDATAELTDGWKTVDPQLLPQRLRGFNPRSLQFAYQATDDGANPLGFQLQRAIPEVSADAVVMVSVSDTFLEYSLALNWVIQDAAIDQLTFTTPLWLKDRLNFIGASIREIHSEAQDDSLQWTIHLHNAVRGRYFALATGTLPPATRRIETPAVQFLQPRFNEFGEPMGFEPVESQRLYVLLVNQSQSQLTSEHGDSIETLTADAIPIRLDREILDQAAELLRIRDVNTLPSWSVRRLQQTAGAPASVNVADLTLVIAQDGSWRCQTVYTIRNRRRQFLAVRLPEGSRLLSLFVQGRPSRPVETQIDGDAVQLIPLPRTSDAEGSFPVKLVCSGAFERSLPASFLAPTSSLDLPAPHVVSTVESAEFGIPVARTLWTVRVPDGVDASLVTDAGRTNVTNTASSEARRAYLKSKLQDVSGMLAIVKGKGFSKRQKFEASNNLKQIGLALHNYADSSGRSSQDRKMQEQLEEVQQEVARNKDSIERYSVIVDGTETGPMTGELDSNDESGQRGQITRNNFNLILSNSGVEMQSEDLNSNGRLDPGEDFNGNGVLDFVTGAQIDSGGDGQPGGAPMDQNAQVELEFENSFEVEIKSGKSGGAKGEKDEGGEQVPGFVSKPTQKQKSLSRSKRQEQSRGNYRGLNELDERDSQGAAQQSGGMPSSGTGSQPSFGTVLPQLQRGGQQGQQGMQQGQQGGQFKGNMFNGQFVDGRVGGGGFSGGGGFGVGGGGGMGGPQPPAPAEGMPAQGSAPGFALNEEFNTRFDVATMHGVGGAIGGAIHPLPGAPAWTRVGGLSLPVDIPATGQELRFSKVSGQPKLALQIRSRDVVSKGVGLVWTGVWIGIGVFLITTFRNVRRPADMWQPAAWVLLAGGLISFLALPGGWSGLGFVCFGTGWLIIIARYVRAGRKAAA